MKLWRDTLECFYKNENRVYWGKVTTEGLIMWATMAYLPNQNSKTGNTLSEILLGRSSVYVSPSGKLLWIFLERIHTKLTIFAIFSFP